jgi:protein TonB
MERMADPPKDDPGRETRPAGPAIFELVFEDRGGRPWPRTAVAATVVVVVYCGAALSMVGIKPDLASRSAGLAARIPADLTNDRTVDLGPTPPAVPVKPTVPPPVAANPRAVVRTSGRASRRLAQVAPAQAAAVITRAGSESPLDLTGNTFVSGGAARLPGGATAGAGRGTAPVTGAADIQAPPARHPAFVAPALARPVALVEGTWTCPWPAEADAEQVDEQTVVIRVRVAEDGTVQVAELVSDPGGGFGRAALSCARRTRFQAARNAMGGPTEAWSPPIRVHFTR